MNKTTIKAWKVDGFMAGLQSVGFDLSSLEMKHSDDYKRFGWYHNDELVAAYDERKEKGYFRGEAKCRYGEGTRDRFYKFGYEQ